MIKRLLSTLVVLCLSLQLFAYDFSAVNNGQTIYYNITSSASPRTVAVASSSSYSGSVVIPSNVTYDGDTYSVTSIGDMAFDNCTGLTSITIPNSVTSIGNYAFFDCSSLTSITIPNSVTSIGRIPFGDCRNLNTITVSSGNTAYDSRNNCNAIIETSSNALISGCKNTIIPNSVTSIGYGAFAYCSGLTSITIPNSVTSIGEAAFRDCPGLTSVSLGNSVTSIGNYAFFDCSSLTSITIPNSVTSIGSRAFCHCTGLTSITIPNSVTSIGDWAFDCSGLTSITIPNSVTSIGHSAFAHCYGLTSITIPNSVQWIGNNVFYNCSGLTSVNIPNSVIGIGSLAFYNCSSLTSINIPNSVRDIGSHAFLECSSLTSITIPNSVTSIGDGAFAADNLNTITVSSGNTMYDSRNNCNAIIETSTNKLIAGCENTIIPNSVTSIGNYAFAFCSGLTSITIPNSVTSIGDQAFYECRGLTSITIPNSVTSIGLGAFANNNLNTITVSSGNTMYDSRNNCNAIIETSTNKLIAGCENTIIPNSVTTIGNYAFYGCSGLTSITIPNSVTSIGLGAFGECTGLASITSLAITAPQLENDVFKDVNDSIPVYFPCGSLQSYSSAWPNFSNFIEIVPYSFSVTSANDTMGEVSVLTQPTCSSPSATIQAEANTGYRFTHWSDGETNNPRIVNVTSDTTIIAHFDVVNGIESNESLVQIYEQGGSFYILGAEGEALTIYDVYGRVIYQGTAEDNKPYEMPQPGVYMVKVGNNPAQKVVIK